MTRNQDIRARLNNMDMNRFDNGLIRMSLNYEKDRYLSKLDFINNIQSDNIRVHLINDLEILIKSLEDRYSNGIEMIV